MNPVLFEVVIISVNSTFTGQHKKHFSKNRNAAKRKKFFKLLRKSAERNKQFNLFLFLNRSATFAMNVLITWKLNPISAIAELRFATSQILSQQ